MRLRVFAILLFLIVGCQQHSRFYITSFDNPVDIKINRFDIDFINIDTNKVSENLSALANKYPSFFPVFITEVLMMNPYDTLGNTQQIKDFLHDKTFIDVNTQVLEEFKDVSSVEKELSTAFSYIKHYFPEISIPEIYFYISGFNQQYLINNEFIGIGTDLYLGADFPLYKEITHEYLIPNMRSELIVTDLLNLFFHNRFPFKGEVNLLNSMIYEGKILFLIQEFTSKQENLIIGYNEEDIKWCKIHEKHIWSRIIEQKHLYSTDYFLINQYINVAPFTSPVSQDSPGRLGVWTGWQIVKSYMQNNTTTDLQELIDNTNYQSILENSHYRP